MKKYFKVLATAVLVASVFCINKKDMSTNENINLSKIDYSSESINKIIDKDDPIHYKKDDNGITTLKTYEVDQYDINKKAKLRGDTFYEGVIGCHYEYYMVTDLTEWRGVFCNYTEFIRKSLLESGVASIECDYSYSSKNYFQQSIYYSNSINLNLESTFNFASSLQFNFGTAKFKDSFSSTTEWTRKNETNYYKEIDGTTTIKKHYKIDKDCTKYCPDAYNIGIGLIGTYYTFDVHYIKYKNIFGDKNVEEGTISCSIAKESSMALSFIYTLDANSNEYYFPSR